MLNPSFWLWTSARAHKKYDKSHTIAVISRTNRQNNNKKTLKYIPDS